MIPTLIVVSALIGVLIFLYMEAKEKHRNAIGENLALIGSNKRLYELWLDVSTSRNYAIRNLLIAKGALNDIANQCTGDPCYEIWARKRAVDTVALIDKPERK